MGFDDLKGKATDALGEHGDKVEGVSDQGLDRAGEFAEGKGLDSEKSDQGREFLDGKIGE
ncbi:Rv0909 family putative TA system antitoxin [Janibacter limosus]|uniref:Rv0909 family putative TA system antitoxin n=1 Tax=Janibacter limosus TaxID=53458 RepID=UPI0008342E3B|nr:Rv0909 family putative TA system antitoxin [Janibacter limosus]